MIEALPNFKEEQNATADQKTEIPCLYQTREKALMQPLLADKHRVKVETNRSGQGES